MHAWNGCHNCRVASPSCCQYACWLMYKRMLSPRSAKLKILWLPLAGPGQMGQPQRASTKQMQLAASWATQRACTRRTTNTEWAALPERSAAICSAESPDDKSHAGVDASVRSGVWTPIGKVHFVSSFQGLCLCTKSSFSASEEPQQF